jgi:transposase
MQHQRDPYPSDLNDAEWEFVAPYLTLMREDAPQRHHSLRAVFDALRYVVRTGCQWRYLPHEFPPYFTVFQQAQRWLRAGVFEAMAHDLRAILRLAEEREANPTATILDSRTVQSTPESGARAGYDGAKKRKGSKVHIAVDTLGHLRALKVTPADEQDRAQVEDLAREVQAVTGSSVELAFVDQGYTGAAAAEQASGAGMRLEVVRLPEAKRSFVLLPRRWVVERSFAWFARFRRLARDYERLAETVKGWHWLAFISLAVKRIFAESA